MRTPGGHFDEGGGWPQAAGRPSSAPAPSSVVDTVELDAATDPELTQPLQGLLAQAGGPQALPVERQLQPSLLAQEQHLGREGVRAADLPTDPVPPARPSSPPRTQRLDPQGAQPWNGTGLGPGVSRCTWLFSALGLSFTICNG